MNQIGTFYLKLRRFTVKMTDEAKKSTVHSFLRYQDEKTAINAVFLTHQFTYIRDLDPYVGLLLLWGQRLSEVAPEFP